MRKITVGLVAALLLVGVAGCSEPTPERTPLPTASATPVFASDEEALAAAEEAYGAYLAVSDAIFADGGVRPERLEDVATGRFLEASVSGFEKVKAKGWRSTGRSEVHSIELQRFDPTGEIEMVVVYLCDDVSAVDVLDSTGRSIVSASRPDRTLFEVSYDLGPDQRLLVSSREVWGDGKC